MQLTILEQHLLAYRRGVHNIMKNILKRIIDVIKNILIKMLYSIPFLIVWYIGVSCVNILYSVGGLSSLDYVYGKYIYYILWIIGIFILTSVVHLRLFIKDELVLQITAVCLSLTFFWSIYFLMYYGQFEFEEFSTEKFHDYPSERLSMYDDLIEKYELKGYSYSQIEELLGKPDGSRVTSEGKTVYGYSNGFGDSVVIIFKDGKVVDHYYSE